MKIFISLLFAILLFVYTSAEAQTAGCPDPSATNYNPAATVNDGSCLYLPALVSVTSSVNISSNIPETSGLIRWDNRLWTHNDNTDLNLYAIDTISGAQQLSLTLNGATNTDWEEIAQDDTHIYVADFGNNSSGNRTDLHILKISKSSVSLGTPELETINFSYSDQVNFTASPPNQTDFDCEAMIVSGESIFLFTKQWNSLKTSAYKLPKTAGTHVAVYLSTLDVQGLITGATWLENKNLLALSGYSTTLQPFIYLLYDFNGTQFFGGNKRKILMNLPLHQVEGIATTDGIKYFISNERLVQLPYVNISQKMHVVNLSTFLSGYLSGYALLTWNGSMGSSWYDAANWTPAQLPQSTNSISIPGGTLNSLVVDGLPAAPAVCKDVTVETAAVLTIAAGKALTVIGTLTSNAGETGIVIQSGGSLIQNNPGVAATVNRTITAAGDNAWHFFISPLTTSIQAAASSIFNGAYLDRYNEPTGAWVRLLTNEFVTPGTGYSVNFPAGDHLLEFPGMLVSGPVSYSNLSYTSSSAVYDDYGPGWNLVGNPYPSGINPSLCSFDGGLNGFAYVWNGVAGNYIPLSIGSGASPGVIASLQGFFIRTTDAVNSLTLANAAKTHGGTFLKSASEVADLLKISIQGNGFSDQAFVHFGQQASSGFDQRYDAYKLAGLDEAPQLYSMLSGEKAAFNTLPEGTTNDVDLGLKVGTETVYTLNFEEINSFDPEASIQLYDLKLWTILDLRLNPAYTFTASPADAENRFRLRFAAANGMGEPNAAGVEIHIETDGISISNNGTAGGMAYLYSVSGQLLVSSALSSGETTLRTASTGLFLLKIVTGETSFTQKVVVR